MKLSDKKNIQQLVLTMAALGLKNVVISPGSRNAPLIISFNRHPGIKCISIRDERSAGFFALGKALELKEPVALLCTSGSATLNFAPAIVEAYYLRLPLIVITADRPTEWIGQGDGQAINQHNIYHNYIRKSYVLDGDAESDDKRWYNARCISEGFAIATQTDPGPVHFNVPLGEPLYESNEVELFKPTFFTAPTVEGKLAEHEIVHLQTVFSTSQKVMLLAGQQSPDDELNALLGQLAAFDNTIVLCESTTNIHHTDFIENIDRCIMPMQAKEIPGFMPDLLMTVGGAVVSKKIKALLRKHKPAHHWNIHPQEAFMDTYKALSKAIPLEANAFLKQFLQNLSSPVPSEYKKQWRESASLLEGRHHQFVENAAYSDFLAFSHIFNKIPENTHLHLGNSTPIRYAQLFKNVVKSTHCNRGASGIDGCTSTAMGAASSNPHQPYVLITGDVGFFYDNNAFWNDYIPGNLKIILMNNAGGSIFRIIPGPSQTQELEAFFETKHHRAAKKLVECYEWNYLSANSEETLLPALEHFFNPETTKTVLEIFTPSQLNSQVLASYFKYLTLNDKT